MNERALTLVALLIAAGCGGGSAGSVVPPPIHGTPGPPPHATPPPRVVREHIKHVVVVVQENRSFDNFFHGFPGARYSTYGYEHDGTKVTLHAASLKGPEIFHGWHEAIEDWDGGKMDGFDLNRVAGKRARTYVYQYVARRYIEPYWSMARQYVLADEMFPTELGGSFTAHLDLIAGTTNLQSNLAEADNPLNQPWGCDAPDGTKTSVVNAQRDETWGGGPFPCFDQFDTMADLLDAANVSWAYYAPKVDGPDVGGKVWSEFDAIDAVRHGPDWQNDVISPASTFLLDASGGRLRDVSWVIPDANDSDHPGEPKDAGPSWVSNVVNAVGESPAWKTTAIVVLWDDWGGFYDGEPPPQLDFRGLGIRVPCIIISPYARKGYVSHTEYEFGSILQFIEEAFGLRSLSSLGYGSGYTDERAYSISDGFDFKQKARPFKPITSPLSREYFLTEKPSTQPPDRQ
ncbi:MAG TPA: alkaline phosphatase family protein [Candidatus Binatia bacterium]|nr:alkaline phosphatase family protein [Candidatus Binatia bacterium]